MFLLVSRCCDTAQALVFLLVSVCCDTAQALIFLLVSMCCDTARALVFLLVSMCCDTTRAKANLFPELSDGTSVQDLDLMMTMKICKAPTPRLKALDKQADITHTMYSEIMLC